MRRFLLKLALFMSIQLAAFTWVVRSHPDPLQPFVAGTVDKHYVAQTAPSPRLIIMGGSNTPYAFHSPMIHAQTGFHPVNMGLFAGLGLTYMLRESRDVARSGDVILLVLEWPHYDGEITTQSSAARSVLLARPANVRYMSSATIMSFLDDGLGLVSEALWNACQNPPPLPAHSTRESLNYYGDRVLHESLPSDFRRPINPGPAGGGPALSQARKESFVATVDRLNAFGRDCAADGIDVVVTFPPFDRDQGEFLLAPHAIAETLEERFEGKVLGKPRDFFMPREMFFDSLYHPTRAGKLLYTRTMLTWLKPYLAEKSSK